MAEQLRSGERVEAPPPEATTETGTPVQVTPEAGGETPAPAGGEAGAIVRTVGDWKGRLRQLLENVPEARREEAAAELNAARTEIVRTVWDRVRAKFPNAEMESLGTVGFESDIDITVKPVEQMPGFEGEPRSTGEQIADAGAAAQRFSELLRAELGGLETDAAIDTNVYAFTGEGVLQPEAAAERAAGAQIVTEAGFAEQRRGQTPEQWAEFVKAVEDGIAGDESAEGQAALRRLRELVRAGEAFGEARERERVAAEERARAENPDQTDPRVIERIARGPS